MTSTFVIAAALRDAINAPFNNAKDHSNPNVVASCQISRMIRNAFAYSMMSPAWSIDTDCRDRCFEIEDVIRLDTHKLHGQPPDWRDYGGSLAMFHFGRFIRLELLGDQVDLNRKKPPLPTVEVYQQGRLVARKLDKLPEGAVAVVVGPGMSFDLGEGHFIRPLADET